MLIPTCSTVAVLGIPFHSLTMDEALDTLEDYIRDGRFHQVATANVDFVKNAMRDRQVRDILCSCDLVVPDGMPIVWMSRLLGAPLKERVCGVDLVERLAELSARRGYRIFLLGASESRSRRAAKVLRQRHPDLRIVGRYSPEVRPLEQMDHEAILARIEEARPDILFVAFGNPKQERWLAMHRDRLNVPVCIGVGGSFDAISGDIPRAPVWMQQSGLEWLHRLCQEPRRLAGRYLEDALCLLRHVPAHLAAVLAQPRRSAPSNLLTRQIGNTRLISTIGNLTGVLLEECNALCRDACAEGMNIVLDLSRTAYLGPDSLGSLIHFENSMRQRREQLWLAQLPSHLERLLRSGRLHNYFLTTKLVSDALYRTAKVEQRLLARFTPPLGTFSEAALQVDVRMELLQGVCRSILSPAEHPAAGMAAGGIAAGGRVAGIDADLAPVAFASARQ
jgi:N-acetylglucosaminyldiphosphoundecaprenol N-acetyl-beta-D-mannosaminyltransferase